MIIFVALILFDLKQAWRKPGEVLLPGLFLALVLTVYGLLTGIAPTASGTPPVAASLHRDLALFWIALLLALFLPFARLFEADRRDGTLDMILLADVPAELLFLAKAAGYWLAHALPMLLLLPIARLILPLGGAGVEWALVLFSVQLSLLLTTGAALVAGSRSGGLLLYILLFPLAVPGIIFATAASLPGSGMESVWLLGGITLLGLAVLPWAAGAALREMR
jgi:heme exporter protein B